MAAMVRHAEAADLAGLAAVERSASQLFAGTHLHWVLEAERFPPARLQAALDAGLLWVADAGADIAGFLVAADHGATLFIEELSVAALHQRRGIGRALLQAALAQAASHGFADVTLITDRTLPWNRSFYESAGFRVLEGPEIPSFIRQSMQDETEHGHDPAARCAMRRDTAGGC